VTVDDEAGDRKVGSVVFTPFQGAVLAEGARVDFARTAP